MFRKIQAFLLMGILAAASGAANAQFAGDVFFPSPSVAVAEGETTRVDLHAFTGADVLGGVHIQLIYDPAQMTIEAIEAPLANDAGLIVTSQLSPGRAAFIALNGQSVEQPIGTAPLASIVVKPLVQAGNYVNLTTEVQKFLRADRSSYANPQGFGLELAVTAASAAGKSATSAVMRSPRLGNELIAQGSLRERAAALARPGAELKLQVLDAAERAQEVAVKTADPDAPAE